MDQVPVSAGEWQALYQAGRADAAQPAWDGAERGSLAAQVEEMLGADCQPDAEFFVRCWTEGAAKAADDYLDRNQGRRRVEKVRPAAQAWNWSGSAASFSTAEFVQWQQMHSWQAQTGPQAVEDEAPEMDGECAFDGGEVLTVERARRVLGVAFGSTAAEIKVAYRQLARRYHPDRVEWKSAQAMQTATGRMIAINQAYCLLSGERAAA